MLSAWFDGIHSTVTDTVTPEAVIGTTVAPEVAPNPRLGPGPSGPWHHSGAQHSNSHWGMFDKPPVPVGLWASSNDLMDPPGSRQLFQNADSGA